MNQGAEGGLVKGMTECIKGLVKGDRMNQE